MTKYAIFRSLPLLLITLFGVAVTAHASIKHQPNTNAIPGGIVILPLGEYHQTPKAFFAKQPVLVMPAKQPDHWQAVVGIPLRQPLGEAFITVNDQPIHFVVNAHEYPSQHVTVQRHHVHPNPEQLARIRRETQQMQPVYRHYRRSEGWPEFIWPLHGRISSPFGFQRFFNGEPRNPHSGLDIAAPTGTPIQAPAAGIVTLTGDFYFNGKSVFIDHGQGLISMMCHLDRIDVHEGQSLKVGDVIGTVGQTGRATGPHLHWTVSLNDARIDPMLVLPKQRAMP